MTNAPTATRGAHRRVAHHLTDRQHPQGAALDALSTSSLAITIAASWQERAVP